MTPRKDLILVLFAVREEAAPFQWARAQDSRVPPVEVRLTGMGPRSARRVALEALDEIQPRLVLTCGFAGGLNPDLAPESVLFDAPEDSPVARALSAAGAIRARVHCSDRVATTAAQKRECRQRTGADAVEMESGVIRELCAERGIPSATARVISDGANEDLPLDFDGLISEDGKLLAGRMAARIAAAPWRVVGLLRLQRRCARAARRLAETLCQALGELGEATR